MKGLLLKDLYMTAKYCRAYALIVVVFLVVSFFGNENLFFVFYPCLMVGLIPVNLLSYDERSKWTLYSGTLPYSKAQIVSGKYLIGLFAQAIVLILTAITQAMIMHRDGSFTFSGLMSLMAILTVLSFVTSSFSLPVIFRWGVEKGRIAHAVIIGFAFAGGAAAGMVFQPGVQTELSFGGFLPLVFLFGLGLYALSWYLSIVFYRKREA